MLPTGTLTLKSSVADNSTMEVVVETKIALPLRMTAKVVAKIATKSHLELNPLGDKKIENQESRNLRVSRVDLLMVNKRTAACYLMHQETAVSKTEGSITTAATAFVANSCTPAVMEMKITLRRWKSARAYAMMLLAFVTWHLCMDVVLKTLRDGITMRTIRNVKSLSSADVTETKIILRTNDHVKMHVNMILEHQSLPMVLPLLPES